MDIFISEKFEISKEIHDFAPSWWRGYVPGVSSPATALVHEWESFHTHYAFTQRSTQHKWLSTASYYKLNLKTNSLLTESIQSISLLNFTVYKTKSWTTIAYEARGRGYTSSCRQFRDRLPDLHSYADGKVIRTGRTSRVGILTFGHIKITQWGWPRHNAVGSSTVLRHARSNYWKFPGWIQIHALLATLRFFHAFRGRQYGRSFLFFF